MLYTLLYLTAPRDSSMFPWMKHQSFLTAMLTPVGIYLYNVLAMGLSNATDIFESCICQILEGLNGVINIADDVLVYGTDYKSFKKNVIGFLRLVCRKGSSPQSRQDSYKCTKCSFLWTGTDIQRFTT